MIIPNFENKKVAVLGFGVEGIDVCHYLKNRHAQITVFDQKDDLIKESGIKFVTGANYLDKGLHNFDFIFRSPGFYRYLPVIVEAEKSGAKILSQTKLFFDLCPAHIIGVTGTKGKGTTANLIYQIFKKAKRKVFLAGNIGKPMLSLLPKLNDKTWVILELSSFQLHDLSKSPEISVVLFIVKDHLNIHKDFQEYVQAKSNILKFQTRSNWAIINFDNKTSKMMAQKTKAQVYFFSREQKTNGTYIKDGKIIFKNIVIGLTSDLKLRGEHNGDNICAAVTVAFLAKIDLKSIQEAVFAYKGLEHRMELVGNFKGVSFYNDSISTIPETTIAAIKSFKEPVVLILGGSDKGCSYHELGKELVKSSVRKIILIGQMADKIQNSIRKAGFKGEIIMNIKSMGEVVRTTYKETKKGDVVLLSPACASFGMFNNYKDRGDQFKNYAKKFSQ